MSEKWPSVTFVTCTLNSGKILKECLSSIEKLDYPKKLVEKIIVDGGSKDDTLKIAKEFKCKIVNENTGKPEAATAIGYQKAKNELIVNFPSDNIIPNKNWLKKMVKPFIKHKEIVGAETCYYEYKKNDTSLNRYFSLFGADTLPYYLDKRDRLSYFAKGAWRDSNVRDLGEYYIVEFSERNTPPIGANGFIIRNKFAKSIAKEPLSFFHIDSCLDLINKGHNKFAFVKIGIWHKTGENFVNYVKKRIRYGTIYLGDKTKRRYHVVDLKYDKLRLFLFVLYTITFVEPLLRSTRGFIKIRDFAWFYNPVLCWVNVFIYAYTLTKFQYKKLLKE